MNTAEIEAFLAILQYGNLTEASKSLFISQSTLSHRLFELEKKVGVALIERRRGGKNLVLTPYGKKFLLIASRWEALVQDTKKIQLEANELSLTIGSVDSIHLFVFPELYRALMGHVPTIHLNLKTYNSAELYLLVDRGEIDVGFTLLELPMRNINVEKIYSEQRVVLIREESPQLSSEKSFITQKELDPNKEIFFVGDTAYHGWYRKWKGEKGYPALQVDTTQLLILLLDQPGSWCIVPQCIARQLTMTNSFSSYYLDDAPPERNCYKIYSKYFSEKMSQILDSYLQSTLQQN